MYELLNELIKPELLILVPVLYLIGDGFKKSQLPDKHIPWVLGAISVILSTMFIVSTSIISGWNETLIAIFSGFTQGVLCAGASVYVNQLVKQMGKIE